jgi:hypothetical protein
MILLIDNSDLHDSSFQENLYNFCAGLCQKSLLTGCLIAYPKDAAARAWLPGFIHSLRSVGISRINFLIPMSQFTPDHLDTIEGLGVYEIIFIEDSFDLHFIDTRHLSVRVWLNWVDWGENHKKVCGWYAYVKNLLSVERAPIRFPDAARPGIGIWTDGPLPENFPLDEWNTRLPLYLVADALDPGAFVAPPEWLFTPDKLPLDDPGDRHFFDYVRDDLTKMTDQKRTAHQTDLLQRIKQNAQTYFL